MEYKQRINEICKQIHIGLIDFSKPRNKASMPTQASSEFITNKQQGDWAEDVIFRAVNNSTNIVAVHYGKSDDLVAGDKGFDDLFRKYQEELDVIGKRPDLLLFKKEDFNPEFGHDISNRNYKEISEYVKKAIVGIEIRSSAFLIDKYNEEAEKNIHKNTARIMELKDIVLSNYADLLRQKRPELISLIESLNETSVRSVDFRFHRWSTSQRLQELSSLLSEIKNCLKIIQKRNSLSITPKVEDLKVVHKWIETYNVPHFYAQVFFDKVYGISFEQILKLIADPNLESEKYFIEQDTKNQNKTTIKIPSQNALCIAQSIKEPEHYSIRKELGKGRLLFYVGFDGGKVLIDKDNFDKLFCCNL